MEVGIAQDLMLNLVNLLVAHLDLTKTPKRVDNAYQDAKKADGTSTERLFLDVDGYSVWLAYFPTKHTAKSTTHFDGQAACNQMLETLDELSVEGRKLLALEVQQAIPTLIPPKLREMLDNTIRPMSTNAGQSNKHFDLRYPPVSRVTSVFPTFLAGAIRTHPLQGITGKLRATIESTDEHRYIVLSTGLRITPNPDLILRGCKRNVILELFGQDIDQAVKAIPAFKEEYEQGNPLAECVTMTISHRAKDGAVINLYLEEKEGFRIRNKLYE